MTATVYPGAEWARVSPAEAGFDPEKLEAAKNWLDSHIGDDRYRVIIVCGGRLVAEWNHSVGRDEQLGIASAVKSIYSCILGILIEEARIPSADAKIVDYYPEAMDVPEGEGPKDGRYAFQKDRDITFRQLISNTSGYMKPGEEPGKVFHYQTFGMNILIHAIARMYGLYDIRDPERSPGFEQLIDERIAIPIGATWRYGLKNFDLHPKARIHIFGYSTVVAATALDLARLGWLWRNWGRWKDKQLVPEVWLREATRTAPDIRADCPQEQWKYGYAFWTNDHGQLWPNLPRDSYAAAGGPAGTGRQHIWVCPSLDLVVAQSPSLHKTQGEMDTGLLGLVVDACKTGFPP